MCVCCYNNGWLHQVLILVNYYKESCMACVIIWQKITLLNALRWPVRTISFNHTGEYIALASEDLFIDIVSIGFLITWELSAIFYKFLFRALLYFVLVFVSKTSIKYSLLQQSVVSSGRSVHQIPCRAAMNSVEWNPKHNLLAYAGDDKNKYQADEGVGAVFLLSAIIIVPLFYSVLHMCFISQFFFVLLQVYFAYTALRVHNQIFLTKRSLWE